MKDREQTRRHSHAWLWLLVILPLLYLGVQVWRSTNRPYRTQTAFSVTLEDSVSVKGVVVRRESVIPQEAAGVVGYVVEDVQRVSAGTEVARVFQSADCAHSFAQAAVLDTRIATLRQAQTDGGNAGTDVNLILRQVNNDLYSYIAMLEGGNYADLQQMSDELCYAFNKLDVAIGEEESFEDHVAQLEAERDGWAAATGDAVPVTAPATGFFFYEVDGYEGLTAETVGALDPTSLDALADTWPREQVSAVGKMVTSYRWQYYCTVAAADAARFTVGKKVTLAFTDVGILGLEGSVSAVSDPDADGRVVACIECQMMDERLSGLRFEAADVSFASFTGIRISKEALHINSEGETGVYIKFGTLVRFRRIEPIFETAAYVLVPVQPEEGDPDNQVSLYDEIIVEGSDLFDGKLL